MHIHKLYGTGLVSKVKVWIVYIFIWSMCAVVYKTFIMICLLRPLQKKICVRVIWESSNSLFSKVGELEIDMFIQFAANTKPDLCLRTRHQCWEIHHGAIVFIDLQIALNLFSFHGYMSTTYSVQECVRV